LKTIGHSLKNLGPSRKTLRQPWCPKLVTGLDLVPKVCNLSRKPWKVREASVMSFSTTTN